MAIGSIRATVAPKQNDSDHSSQKLGSSAIKNGRKTPALKRALIIGCLGFSALGMTGCTLGTGAAQTLSNCESLDDFMVGYRNRAMAEKAWHCRKHSLCDTRYIREYKDGFISGYMDVASGGAGCTPAMAPSQYWGWKYQTAGGHCAVNAWFQGFPQGARAAEEDGVGHWQGIRMNSHQSPAAYPAGLVPLAIPSDDEPAVSNPFYPEQDLEPDLETLEEEDPNFRRINPSDLESIDVPASPEPDESVFDNLFPPVEVETVNDSALSAAEVVADGSISDDDDSLQFSFE